MSPRKTTSLRQLLRRPGLDFLMEAHSGLSAKIVEEAGFEGIWASGLALSASYGVRDNNELSWSQVTDHVAFMADCTTIPILLDGDTGYGNFNNMRRLVRKLEQVGAAGVVIEDKLFPKLNSFLRSELQPLADVDEFCGKIKAGKDSQRDEDFVVIARVEALVAGWGVAEAVRRAEAYHQAGADAILIHSKQPTPAEVFAFLEQWDCRSPIVLVPTKYYTTATEDFRARNVSIVIWANHLLRTSIVAMRQTADRLFEEQSLINVEPEVATLQEVFRLQGDHELEAAEAQYLPAESRGRLSAIVLAASAGDEFGSLTDHVPKAMLKVSGQPILARLAEDFESFGCRRLTIVRGYGASGLEVAGARYVENSEYAQTNEAYSLSLAVDALHPGTLVSFGDLVLKRYIVHSLLEESDQGITVVVDSKLVGPGQPDAVNTDRPYSGRFDLASVHLQQIGSRVCADSSDGAWIGLLHVGDQGATWLAEAVEESRAAGVLRSERIADLLTRVVGKGRAVRVVYIHGGWINVNRTSDLLDAGAL